MNVRRVLSLSLPLVFATACGDGGTNTGDSADTSALEVDGAGDPDAHGGDADGTGTPDDTDAADTDATGTDAADTDDAESDGAPGDVVDGDTAPDADVPFTPTCGEDETGSITDRLATTPPAAGTPLRYRAIVQSCLGEAGIVAHVYLRYAYLPDPNDLEYEEVLCGQRLTVQTTGASVDPKTWLPCTDCIAAFEGVTVGAPTSFGNFCDAIGRSGAAPDVSVYQTAQFLVFGTTGVSQKCAFVPHPGPLDRYWKNIAGAPGGVMSENLSGGLDEARQSCRYRNGAVLRETYP